MIDQHTKFKLENGIVTFDNIIIKDINNDFTKSKQLDSKIDISGHFNVFWIQISNGKVKGIHVKPINVMHKLFQIYEIDL